MNSVDLRRPDGADVAHTAASTCIYCGSQFGCGLNDPQGCWCAQQPILRDLPSPELPPDRAGCLCPACLPIEAARQDFMARVQSRLDQKTKPLGALGDLEVLACRIAGALGTESPVLHDASAPASVLIFAADHGLAAHGVSAYPREVTAQMVLNFLRGGAAISVLARQHGLAMQIIDCGVDADFAALGCQADALGQAGTPRAGHESSARLIDAKLRRGSRDMLTEPAMTEAELDAALANGRRLIAGLPRPVVLIGEMGIGNTSSAALIAHQLLDLPLADCVGPGTGVHGDALTHKHDVLHRVVQTHVGVVGPRKVLQTFGGLELATMVGAMLEVRARQGLMVIDGAITTAALVVAHQLDPRVLKHAVFSHCGAEPVHRRMLEALQAKPLLHLGLRLGEASGAALAWPLLVSATAILNQMASFADAGVSQA